jgi:5-methyltetrahydrofolate--homocysteine methyltransferase
MSRFLQALGSGQVLLMDGAMGTELQRAGIGAGECYELWNLTRSDQVRAIHQRYLDAGARCLVANTFQANPAILAKHGRADDLEAINLLASIGPMDRKHEDFARVVRSLADADGLLLETWSTPFAALAAITASNILAEAGKPVLPVLLSYAFRWPRGARVPALTQGDHSPTQAAVITQSSSIAALGVNCGPDISISDIAKIVRRFRRVTEVPIFARPNAGTPTRVGNQWVYPQTPDKMADQLAELLEEGVTMVGGCCGTTPEHIAAFRRIVEKWNAH